MELKYLNFLKKETVTFLFKYAGKSFVIGVFAVLVCMNYLARHQVFRFDLYNVVSSSMSPSIKKGSLVISEPRSEYLTSDVITFFDPRNTTSKVAHRISEIEVVNGETLYKTKGDSNKEIDPWQISDDLISGKVVFNIPWIGYIVSIIQSPLGVLIFIILPVGGLFFLELEELLKNIRRKVGIKEEGINGIPYGV